MPCTDGGVPYQPSRTEKSELKNMELTALLCAYARTFGTDGLPAEAFQEAGVSKKRFVKWWTLHKKRDDERRAEEAREAEHTRLQQEALAKLTPAERNALGF